MLSITKEIDGVKYTVNAENGWHVIKKRQFYARVYMENDPEGDAWYEYGRALVQSSDVETPFLWPDVTDTYEELKAARDKWLALPADVIRAWLGDLDAVNAAPVDPSLKPDANLKNVESQQ
jgi:hypothetical protein